MRYNLKYRKLIKKIIGIFFIFLVINSRVSYAQSLYGDAQLEIKIYRMFSNTFRVKEYAVSSGKIAIDPKKLEAEKIHKNADTEFGIGKDNMFSNYGGRGYITLCQLSPFRGISANFLFEELVNDQWVDAAKLYVDMPVIGSNSIVLQYYRGFGNNNFDVNTYPSYSGYPFETLARGYGYVYYDLEGNASDFKRHGQRYLLEVDVAKRAWLQNEINIPTNGSTTYLGTVSINNQNLKLRPGVSFEEAVKKTISINVNSFSKANWVVFDNNNSRAIVQDPIYVGNTQFYDFDEAKGTFKYKVSGLPNIFTSKYYLNGDDIKKENHHSGDLAIFLLPQYGFFGKVIANDTENKLDRTYAKFYLWPTIKQFDDANLYWENTNEFVAEPTKKYDIDNLKNGEPVFKVFVNSDPKNNPNFISYQGKDSYVNGNGEVFIKAPSYVIDGVWAIANESIGYVYDPNFNSVKNKFNPIINPSLIENNLEIENVKNGNGKKFIDNNGLNKSNQKVEKSKILIKKTVRF
jgi:hypothetical protein